ncbi:hypothetical protein CFP56_042474 [Quercus suber]|uniref:Uncharacterized protein n=1 Tax=Quercus suber TaxID=58331 RepID=A0AAW0ITA8_QUESU
MTSDDLSIELGGNCKITLPLDNCLATYSKTARGKIVSGKIAKLDGIQGWHGHRQGSDLDTAGQERYLI